MTNTHDNGRLFGWDGVHMWTEPTLSNPSPAHRCIGPPTGPDYQPCTREPVARTPYQSVWSQRPICLACATVWCNGRTPEIVSPYSQGSEWHYTTL